MIIRIIYDIVYYNCIFCWIKFLQIRSQIIQSNIHTIGIGIIFYYKRFQSFTVYHVLESSLRRIKYLNCFRQLPVQGGRVEHIGYIDWHILSVYLISNV